MAQNAAPKASLDGNMITIRPDSQTVVCRPVIEQDKKDYPELFARVRKPRKPRKVEANDNQGNSESSPE